MGFDINKVFISGRLVKDPEFKKINTAEGNNYDLLVFTIANSGSRDGDNTNFFDCQLWGKSTSYFSDKLKKGSALIVEGTLKQRRWTSQQDNTKQSRILINVEKIVLINPKYNDITSGVKSSSEIDKHISEEIEIVDQEEVQDSNFYGNQIGDANFDEEETQF